MVKRNPNINRAGNTKAKKTLKAARRVVQQAQQSVATVKKQTKSLLRRSIEGGAGFIGDRFGLGALAKNMASKGLDMVGVGDYRFADGTVQRATPPTRIVRKEYVRDVMSSTDYQVWSHQINPAHDDLFPWLSQIATSFTSFEFVQLGFKYIPTSGNAVSSANNALGTVGMVTNYDPAAPAFPSKNAAETYTGRAVGIPSQVLYHGVECKKSLLPIKRFFVNNSPSEVSDAKFMFPGKVNVFTDGQQLAGVKLGELWIEYNVLLHDPLLTPIDYKPVGDYFFATSVQANALQIFGPTPNSTKLPQSNLGSYFTLDSTQGTFWNRPKGLGAAQYLLAIWIRSGAVNNIVIAGSSSSNNLSLAALLPTQGSQATLAMFIATVSDTEAAMVKLTQSGGQAGAYGFYCFAMPLPTNIESMSAIKQQIEQTKMENLFTQWMAKMKQAETIDDESLDDLPELIKPPQDSTTTEVIK